MSNDTTLEKFLNELYSWSLTLKNYWDRANVKGKIDEDTVESFEYALNYLFSQILYYLENKDEFSSEVAHVLKNDATKLAVKWEQLLKQQKRNNDDSVGIGEHQLPPLPYAYNALEPYISEEIMRLHHDQHHRSYVNGLNKAEREMADARRKNQYELIKHWEREAAFHGAGHYLHTIFWSIMSPDGGGSPKGSLLSAIKKSFGSFDRFKKHFSEAAKQVEGVGWAILIYSPRTHRLEILQAEKHQNLSQWDIIPLLVLDVWEHAYYLQYKNKRDQYVDKWWNVVNWDEVEMRFKEAQKVKWQPY